MFKYKRNLTKTMLSVALLLVFASFNTNVLAQIPNQNSRKGYGFFIAGGIGTSPSFAENSKPKDMITFKQKLPSLDISLGYSFTPVIAFRLTGAHKTIVSRCSQAVVDVLPDVYGEGIYKFNMLEGTGSVLFNMTNLFGRAAHRQRWNLTLFAGGGVLRTYKWEESKIKGWRENLKVKHPGLEDPYSIKINPGFFATAHLGVQGSFAASNHLDITLEFRASGISNNFNGVNNGGDVDFTGDLRLGVVYFFKARPSKKIDTSKITSYTDPLLKDMKEQEEIKRGNMMKTTIPFYTGYYFINDQTLKKVEKVANMMRKFIDMNICIVGYPDIVEGQDVEKNLRLATNRAEAVKSALVNKFKIDESRIRVTQKNETLVPTNELGDWIPSVAFIME